MGIFDFAKDVIPGKGVFDPITASEQITSPEQQALLNEQIIPLLTNLFANLPNELKAGFPTFDEGVPGLTDLQRGAIEGVGGGERDPLLQRGRDTISDILARADPGSAEFEEFFRTNVSDPLRRQAFEGSDSILSTLKRRGAGGDALFGSGTARREDVLGTSLLSTLGRERSNLSSNFVQSALSALGLSEPFTERADTAAGLQNALAQFGLGGAERQVGVEQRGGRLAEFLRQIESRDALLASGSNVALSKTLDAFGGPSVASQISEAVGSICWVAAVYFNWYTPEWLAARNWLMRDWKSPVAPLFRRFYIKYGERLAPIVAGNKLLYSAIKPFFVWASRRGTVV